jgi:hypothetical protein
MQSTTTHTLGRRLLAARPDAPDFRDFIYEPALIALRPGMPVPPGLRIRDQGRSAACTGFGLAAVIDLLRRRDGDRDRDVRETAVSARMLYEMALRHDEWAGEADFGSSCRGAIKGWYNMGVCRETLYPSATSHRGGWSVEAAKDARKCTVGAYYRLGSRISDYHTAINEVGAILCSARLHEGWKKPDPATGHIKLYRNSLGGHAFAIVGYDNEGFWIQNSWGENWGNGGTALWTYPDWQLNVLDTWVFQLALPTPQIWHLPARTQVRSGRAANPARTEIAGHFVHIDDGRFRDTGRYWSNLDDVRLTARHLADSDKYDHLLLYAHGGLNSPEDSARRIAAMKETFKTNRIYPYHLMYDTGLLEELKDVIVGRRKQADDRAGGLADWIDRLIEKLTRMPGRALWREMKAGAELPFKDGQAGTQTLQAFVDAFEGSGKPKAIHLAGHSTGMILLAHLLQRWSVIAPGHIIRTVSLMAPAGGIDLFTEAMQPLLKAPYPGFRIAEMAIYNLTDELEQDDQVSLAYNKSLLYLVSHAFEEQTPAPILGMEKYSEMVSRRKLPRLTVRYSRGNVRTARVTASESHGGFDNDPLTMNHILRRVLRSGGQKPVREFTAASLEY